MSLSDRLTTMLKPITPSPGSPQSQSRCKSAWPSTSPASSDEPVDFVDLEKGASVKPLIFEEEAAVVAQYDFMTAAPYDFMTATPYDFMNTAPDDFTDIEQGLHKKTLLVEAEAVGDAASDDAAEDNSDYDVIKSSDIAASFEQIPRTLRQQQYLRRT